MTDEARAVAESAKFGAEIVKAAGNLGGYLAGLVGTIPHDLLGIGGGDWLGHKRKRNLARLEVNTERILKEITAERLTEPSPSVVIPLLQAAIDEGRLELQGLWAGLLASAMIDGGKRVRRDYFEAVRQMEPVDALVFDIISRRPNAHSFERMAINADIAFVDDERAKVALSSDDYEITKGKLVSLDVIRVPAGDAPRMTPFGRGLLAACRPI